MSDDIWRPANYRERLQRLNPIKIAAWFKGQGWQMIAKEKLHTSWRIDRIGYVAYVDLPKNKWMADFAARMDEVVEVVAYAMGQRGWVAFEYLAAL
jgi:hypothetical protein